MNRSEQESLAAEAAYYDELQRQRDAEGSRISQEIEADLAATRESRRVRPQDDVLDWQDAEYARNQAAIEEAWRQHTAPSGAELQRRVEQLVRQRKEHLHTTHPQERIDYQERIDNLQWKIDELQRQLDQQIRNHHELCTTMSSVLGRLQALDRLEDTTQARPYEDEGDIPF